MPNQPVTPKVKSIEIPWKVLVHRADPNFEYEKRNETFYRFTGRVFRGNNATSGPYSSKPHDNP